MRIIVAALAGLMLTGAAPTASPSEAEFIAAVRAGLETRLVDYPSARFRGIRMTAARDYLCGEVNSRNRMGGMSGWIPMYAVREPEGVRVVAPESMPDLFDAMRAECADPAKDWLPQDFSTQLPFDG